MASSKSIYFADGHCPYLDMNAWKDFLDIVKFERPDNIVNLGDWVDFYQISRFDKDPQRVLELQKDLDFAIERQEELRRVAPVRSKLYYKGGNHDGERLIKWLGKHPEVSGLRSLTLPSLLELDRFGIKYIPPNEDFYLNGLKVIHGTYVAPYAGGSALKELKARGVNGISGHVHRSAKVPHRFDFGPRFWIECGCMCDLRPNYLNDPPNWQQSVWIIETDLITEKHKTTEMELS